MKQTEIKALIVEPLKEPKVVGLKTDLDSLQKAVSIGVEYQGLIEIISLGDGTCILCNEEGKLIGLEGNRRVGNDIIAGVFYVVGENENGELISLNEKQIKYYILMKKTHLIMMHCYYAKHPRRYIILRAG